MINPGPALAQGRAAFESRMRGTCRITRHGPLVTDENGDVSSSVEVIYPDPAWPGNHPHRDGRGYARYPGLAFEQNADSQGVNVAQSRIVYRVPFGPIFRPDDVVEILTDPDNPQLAGTRLRVASIDDQSQATAQRLICEDNQRGVA